MAVHVLTTLEILVQGLLAVGCEQRKSDRVSTKKNISGFRSNCVCHPRICAELFARLQMTDTEEAKLDCSALGVDKTANYFFMAMYLLADYPTEEQAETALLTFATRPLGLTPGK